MQDSPYCSEVDVRDHLPLKQGLRLIFHCGRYWFHKHVRDHLPLKQGLRHPILFSYLLYIWEVRDHLPLKQGLRPVSFWGFWSVGFVRDHLPLKQGLRRYLPLDLLNLKISQRPSSIKTRIKTQTIVFCIGFCHRCQRPSSIKTRIKTIFVLLIHFVDNIVRDHLPLKQGLRHVLN